jgi:hypothetical protein
MTDQMTYPLESTAHEIRWLRKFVVLFLLFTSVPAGFAPCMAVGAYREALHEQQVSIKWRNQARIEDAWKMVRIMLGVSVAAVMIQLGISWLALRKWNELLLGFRGAGWFVLIWCAFAVGVGFGAWISCVAPV